MIDKIDRPEAPQPYQITRPKDAKESRHQGQSQREEEDKRRQKELTEKAWGKFDKRTTIIKPLRAAREEIIRCIFRQVTLHSGMGILQVDVLWKDGRRTIGALVLLKNLEEFVHLKKMAAGQNVPDSYWARGNKVEFGILEIVTQGTNMPPAPSAKKAEAPARAGKGKHFLSYFGIVDATGEKIIWGIVALYVFLIAIITIAIAMEKSR